MIHVALYKPEIPPNTGNIGRLTLGTETRLHIIGEPSFQLDRDTAMKRAGLDYWENVELELHENWQNYQRNTAGEYVLVTKYGDSDYTDREYRDETHLIFGGETRGVPDQIQNSARVDRVRIPMNNQIRSYNLANSVAIVLFEVIRQVKPSGFESTPFVE